MSTSPALPMPSAEVCDVWSVSLSRQAATTARLDVLDPSEKARAARLVAERDRERFATCRAALRVLLSRYLHCEPAGIHFDTGPHGRPFLKDAPLDFNVSHSADLALIIVGSQGPLGVDLEALRPVLDPVELAARYFHAEERKVVEAATARDESFLTCWTRKEAVLKSIGVGLTLDPRRIKVGASTEDRNIRLSWQESRHQVTIRSFDPVTGYVAASVTPRSIKRLEMRSFEVSAR